MSRLLKWKSSKGISLIEVVITVVILSAGLVFVARSFSYSLRSTRKSVDYLKAMSLLEDKMFEWENKGQIGLISESGAFPQAEGGFTWRLKTGGSEIPGLNKLILFVNWKDGGVFLTTYLKNEESIK